MNTPSFICGMCIGSGVTAMIAAQPDWWLWILSGVVVVIYMAWKDAKAEHEAKRESGG